MQTPKSAPARTEAVTAIQVGTPCRDHVINHISRPQKTPKKPPISSVICPKPMNGGGGTAHPMRQNSFHSGGAAVESAMPSSVNCRRMAATPSKVPFSTSSSPRPPQAASDHNAAYVARSSSRNASPSSRSSTSSHGFASGYGGTPVGFPPSSARPASVGFSKSWSSQISATILPCSHRPHSPNRRLQASSSPRSICSTTNCTKPASEAMCQPTLLPPIIVGGG